MSERKFIFSGFSGCSNHSCVVHGKRAGIGTNGPCHCVKDASRTQLNTLGQRLNHAINKYDETIRTQQSTIDRLTEQRDRLLAMLKENVTMFEAYVDGMNCVGARALIAEIEAGNE